MRYRTGSRAKPLNKLKQIGQGRKIASAGTSTSSSASRNWIRHQLRHRLMKAFNVNGAYSQRCGKRTKPGSVLA